MEVIWITEKSLQKTSKSELRSQDYLTINNKGIYTELTSTKVLPYYYLVIDYKTKIGTKVGGWPEFIMIKECNDLLQMMMQKYHSKILYTIYKVGFSSKHLARCTAKVSGGCWNERIFSDLESMSIIKRLESNDEDQDIIRTFWNNEFCNTHRKKAVKLYIITKDFMPVIEGFSNLIEKRFFSRPEISYLNKLRKSFESYAEGVRKNLKLSKAANAKKLGNCFECGRTIRKGDNKGDGGYHVFNTGLVCDKCKRAASREVQGQWMRKNK